MEASRDVADLSFLKGRELEMICFSAYSLYLHFPNEIIITIEGPFQHQSTTDTTPAAFRNFPLRDSNLISLLTHRVDDAHRKKDGSLQLEFSNGNTIVIAGQAGPYESYNVTSRGVPVASSRHVSG
jgi:uncharacterized protein DUF6188